MTKWRRTALWATAILALAAIAAALALPKLVDPERLKRLAREKAQAAWSRELSIGELSLTLWPLPALHAEGIALANPAWAKARPLATAESIDAHLELLPLLFGKVRVKSLDLDGVRVNLETAADGSKSWDLAGAGGAGAKPAKVDEGDLLNLTQLTIRNAEISRRVKGAAPTVLRIEGATLEADPGLRDVRVEANVLRNRKPLSIKAAFADLSRFGKEGATTEGKIDLDWGKTQLVLAGRLPLDAAMKGYALTADLKATSMHDMAAFFGDPRRPTAPVAARFTARESEGKTEIGDLIVTFGKHTVTGALQLARAGAKTTVGGRLETPRLDWEKALLEVGYPALPPLPPEELFHDNELAWPLLASLDAGTEGAVDLKLGAFVVRNGVELKNVKARAAFVGDRLNVNPFTMDVLGGSGSGTMVFEGRKKTLRVTFDGTNLLLERWFRERGSDIPFTGGPMKVKAAVTLAGDTMKKLMASITGPVTLRMGPGVWASEKAGHAEDVMASAFSNKSSASIDFECAGASLPFVSGRATAKPLIGARSTVSNLLTSGYVDFRDQELDLRGRVQPRTGTVGLASIAGDIQITGKLRAPKTALDSISAPSAVMRGAAALATLGLSAVGTATADAESARKSDPCEAVFAK
jgi:hypothetical protein